jgi:hypothetical protein
MLSKEQAVQELTITQLTDHEGNAEHLLNDLTMPIHKIVDHEHLLPRLLESAHCVTADVASPTSDQDCHDAKQVMQPQRPLCGDIFFHTEPIRAAPAGIRQD